MELEQLKKDIENKSISDELIIFKLSDIDFICKQYINEIANIKQQIEEIKLNEDKAKKEKEVSLLGLKKGRDNEESDSKIKKREKANNAKKISYINNKNLSNRKGNETLFNKRLQKYPELRKYWDI